MTEYQKVGRINFTVAKQAHIKSADVMINANHIKHIDLKHNKELTKLGIDALDFVKLIVKNFNEIREGKENSLFLVINNNIEKSFVAAIQLNYNENKAFWEIKTAIPMKMAVLNKRKLLWVKGANPFR